VFSGAGPIEATLDYLRFVLGLAARGRAAGVSPLDAARQTDLGRFADWPDAERLVGNLHRAYAELGGTPRGGAIDVMDALADMVAYNGGKPLTCLALCPFRPHHSRRAWPTALADRPWQGAPGRAPLAGRYREDIGQRHAGLASLAWRMGRSRA
jgi:hypothetical protein